MTEPVRVVVADDHPAFRAGLIAMLGTDPELRVVGEAADGADAIRLGVDPLLAPDVVIMDLAMPQTGGVEATRELRRRAPGVRVLVLTMSDADRAVFAALRAGAHGYLLKDAGPDEILTAVHAVAGGRAIFGSRIAERVLAYFSGSEAAVARPFPELSDRERDVLELLARGLDNAGIAAELVLSRKTVRNHVSNVLAKLQATDRTAAAIAAREAGLGRDPS